MSDCTLPTTSTKKPAAIARPTPRTINPIVMCLGISVRGLCGVRESLDCIRDRVDEPGQKGVIRQRLYTRRVIQVTDLDQQRRHRCTAQNCQRCRMDGHLPSGISFVQFILKDVRGSRTRRPMCAISE